MEERARGTGPLGGLFLRGGPPSGAAAYTDNLSDRLALRAFPEENLRELSRLCDASPAMAPDLIKFATELLNVGIELGRDDAIDEIAAGARKRDLPDPSPELRSLLRKYGI